MTTGEPSPWAPGAAPGPEHPSLYDGPWRSSPGAPAAVPPPSFPSAWPPPAPAWPDPYGPGDDALRRLPPPAVGVPGPLLAEQRPAVVGLAVTLAVVASMLWLCGLSLFLLVASAGTRALGPAGEDGVLFHLLDEAVLRMRDGLWVPLYGFPLVSVVTGFCLLVRRPWAPVVHSAVGVVSLVWAAWWLRDSLLTWFVVAVYVGLSVGVLWLPSTRRWYARRVPGSPAAFTLSG